MGCGAQDGEAVPRTEGGRKMGRTQEFAVFYRHFDLPANFPLIALLGPTWVSLPEPIRRIHFHNCLEIGYLYEGSGVFCVDGELVPVEAPCITLVPQNMPHFTRAAEGSLCRRNWLYTDPLRLLPHLSPQAANALRHFLLGLSPANFAFSGAEHPQAHALLRMVLEEMGDSRPNGQEVVRELMGALFLVLLRRQGGDAPRRSVNRRMASIEPAISHIAANYMNDVSVEALAELCHVSVSHFRRLFKQVLGWAPQEYLQIIRVDRACAMLYNCDYSIAQIAENVGYPTTSSFNRQFKRLYGMSPSRWRQKIRGEENPVVTAYFNALPQTTMQFFPTEYDSYERTEEE